MKSNLSRRNFIKLGATAGLGLSGLFNIKKSAASDFDVFSFGIVADAHYADKSPRNNRHYRDSIAKLRECVYTFNKNELPFAAYLGDLIDKAPNKKVELEFLATIRSVFSDFQKPKHFVLGNHDLAKLSKSEFLNNCGGAKPKSYYSFDEGRFHFVILDANFKKNGEDYDSGNFKWKDANIHRQQRQWLKDDLKQAGDKKTLVFVHQNLDDDSSPYGVNNGANVRTILEKSGNVLAVFQGHDHKGKYRKLNGIHYFTIKALVDGAWLENNSYAMISIDRRNRIRIQGYGKQEGLILD